MTIKLDALLEYALPVFHTLFFLYMTAELLGSAHFRIQFENSFRRLALYTEEEKANETFCMVYCIGVNNNHILLVRLGLQWRTLSRFLKFRKLHEWERTIVSVLYTRCAFSNSIRTDSYGVSCFSTLKLTGLNGNTSVVNVYRLLENFFSSLIAVLKYKFRISDHPS